MSDWKSDSSGWSQPAADGGFKDAAGGYNASGDSGMDGGREVTHTSWFDRIKNALAGVVIGILLIPASCWLLFWNEGRAVTTARSLTEGAGLVRSAPADAPAAANEGQLVYVTAPLRVTGELRDPLFPMRVTGATRLVRTVEMYQWREESRTETRTRMGGGEERVTTYSYSRTWSSSAIDSGRFRQPGGHQNPPMPHRSNTVTADGAALGGFRLTQDQLASFGRPTQLAIDANDAAWRRPNTHVVDGALYLGPDPASPRVGDIRVTFTAVRAEAASIVARQAGNGFAPYQTRAGDRVFMLSEGTVPAADMFRSAEEGNRILTWILRAVGLLVMAIGFAMIMAPLRVLADVVPLFGSIVGFGTGLIGLALTFVLGPLVIATAWFWYRPIVAGIVLAAGVAVAFGISALARARARSRVPAAPAAPMPVQGGWGR